MFSALCMLCAALGCRHKPRWAYAFLQSLCMQVPSFDNKVAMTMIQQELGRPWQEVYSQLTPRPIAAASLGQVCLRLCNMFAMH